MVKKLKNQKESLQNRCALSKERSFLIFKEYCSQNYHRMIDDKIDQYLSLRDFLTANLYFLTANLYFFIFQDYENIVKYIIEQENIYKKDIVSIII